MQEQRTMNRLQQPEPGVAQKCQMKNKRRMLYSADWKQTVTRNDNEVPCVSGAGHTLH